MDSDWIELDGLLFCFLPQFSPFTVQQDLPMHPSQSDVFNDLAIHMFPYKWILEAEDDLWITNLLEPQYEEEDAEFIMKNAT